MHERSEKNIGVASDVYSYHFLLRSTKCTNIDDKVDPFVHMGYNLHEMLIMLKTYKMS